MQPENGEETRFNFDGFSIDRIVFTSVERAARGDSEPTPHSIDMEMKVSGSIGLSPDSRHAEMQLIVKLAPDPKWQPYRIEVGIVGRFTLVSGSPEVFHQFVRHGVGPILFPFIREAVHRTTKDSRYGPVLLAPVNIREMLNWELPEQIPMPTSTTEP